MCVAKCKSVVINGIWNQIYEDFILIWGDIQSIEYEIMAHDS